MAKEHTEYTDTAPRQIIGRNPDADGDATCGCRHGDLVCQHIMSAASINQCECFIYDKKKIDKHLVVHNIKILTNLCFYFTKVVRTKIACPVATLTIVQAYKSTNERSVKAGLAVDLHLRLLSSYVATA